MRYLKTKNISKYSINDRTLIAYPNGNGPGNRVVMNASGGLMLPKGTTAQRPELTNVRQPTDANGTIRYNTTIPALEAYVGGSWVVVASPLANAITKGTHGPGDGVSTVWGPLNPTYASVYAASPHNIIVLVENVFQIAPGNFGIEQNPTDTGTGSETNATSLSLANNGTQYVITDVGTTDFTSFGASANTVGTVFTKTNGTPTGTGKVRQAGYYLRFTSAIPATGGGGNPVYITIYYGFAS